MIPQEAFSILIPHLLVVKRIEKHFKMEEFSWFLSHRLKDGGGNEGGNTFFLTVAKYIRSQL